MDAHFLQLTFVELADGDRALVIDRLDDAPRFEAADDVLGLRDVAVGAEVAVAAPVPLTKELAEVVEDRLPLVDLDAAQDVRAMADECVGAIVD